MHVESAMMMVMSVVFVEMCVKSMLQRDKTRRLTTETVQGAALSLESIDNVEGGDGLALGVLSVGDSVTDDTLKEGLENTTGFLVDH